MSKETIVTPPIKCQGIKTKLVPLLKKVVPHGSAVSGRWIEPFCGSGVVPLNIAPPRALLGDANIHIIRFYKALQQEEITPVSVRSYLEEQDQELRERGQAFYNEVRDKFNKESQPLDFLFLNRACFNGVMRFNRKGGFNVPFCHKPERFAQAYITKIVNQVKAVKKVLSKSEWCFASEDFRVTLSQAKEDDFLYLDPPYFGRHTDYFNSWSQNDEDDLLQWLRSAPCMWALSTWYSNKYRSNETVDFWKDLGYYVQEVEHFYHVGANEELRHPMLEAVVTNYKPEDSISPKTKETLQLSLLA